MTKHQPHVLRKVPVSVLVLALIGAVQITYILGDAILGILSSENLGVASVLASFYFILAGVLGIGLFAVYQGRRFGQPLVLVWELFAVIIGVQTALGGYFLMGIASTALAGACVLLLFTKETLLYLASSSQK
ncbi:hypothetical protein [Rothia nasimurium]|uniref:hypothetical protein n=1 Tax=Rothia nasimurium TaxID=85336 RepID=UPI001F19D397|nr:hypothetical protein [Rothia nasimurium]